MTVFLSPLPLGGGPVFIPGGNQPAAGGQLFFYASGTSTKQNTYTTSSGSVANANPVVLDAGGNVTGSHEIWMGQGSTYRVILAPSNDSDPPLSPYWTIDSISGINDFTNATLNVSSEWISFSTVPVFSNASTFILSGDQTQTFTVGRRVKTINTGGTVYGTITSSVFGTSTTIFQVADSGNLDSGLNAVSFGMIGTTDGSIPWTQVTSTGLNESLASVTTASLTSVGSVYSGANMTTVGNLTVSTGSLFISSTNSASFYVTSSAFNISTSANTARVITSTFAITGSTVQIGTFSTSPNAVFNVPAGIIISISSAGGVTSMVESGTLNSIGDILFLNRPLLGSGVLTRARSATSDPTSTDIPNGMYTLWRNTAASTTKFWYNNNNTMQSSVAFTP